MTGPHDYHGNIHPDDDMARNVLRERQREAAPSKEEVNVQHRKWLTEQGCCIDGCDETDPDKLTAYSPWSHPCPGIQDPPGHAPRVYCDDHAHLRKTMASWKVERTKTAVRKEFVDALVWYECGMGEDAEPPTMDDGAGNRIREPYPTPLAPTNCPRCGADLDYVDYLEYPEEWLDV